jgi:hypothetical protein
MLSTTLDALHSSNAIELLIALLDRSMDRDSPNFREISNQVLNTMYNLCRLSKVRQEDAAVNGIIPLLKRVMARDRPPKEFALPILCDMAHSGKVGRKYLWQNRGLPFYISLLADQYWQVTALDAIFIWLQEETARVEKCLLDGTFTEAIVKCFTTPKATAFDHNLLEPLQKLLRLSPPVAISLARPDMFLAILQKLSNKKAVIRLNLLRIVRSICDPNEDQGTPTIRKYGMFEAIETLSEADPAVLVRNMASELVKLTVEREQDGGSGGRRQSIMRNGIYTSPTLMQGNSTPNTPTHASRSSQSNAFIAGSITPRRAATPLDIGDSLVYRPRSRDGSSLLGTRRTSAEVAAGKSRLPRTAALRSSRSSMAAPTLRDETRTQTPPISSAVNRESSSGGVITARGGVRTRGDGRPSAIPPLVSSASHSSAGPSNSKRRPRQGSGDIRWS